MIKFEKLPADILSRIPNAFKLLEENQNVIFAYLFGGLAQGRVSPMSDVDIAVYLRDILNLAEYKFQLFDLLTDTLGTCELDLVILNTAPISLTGRILQTKKVLVDKEPFQRHIYESVTLRKFFDFRAKESTYFLKRYGIG